VGAHLLDLMLGEKAAGELGRPRDLAAEWAKAADRSPDALRWLYEYDAGAAEFDVV